MTQSATAKQLQQQMERLPSHQQQRVLEFVASLTDANPRGVPGKVLLAFAGMIESSDLLAMSRAIEQGCEKVNGSEW